LDTKTVGDSTVIGHLAPVNDLIGMDFSVFLANTTVYVVLKNRAIPALGLFK
jgi:hypothetical protein